MLLSIQCSSVVQLHRKVGIDVGDSEVGIDVGEGEVGIDVGEGKVGIDVGEVVASQLPYTLNSTKPASQ